jgi:RNA polymerase sigma-70 factor, ECF subfamily
VERHRGKRPPQVEFWFAELYKAEHDRVFQVAYALSGDAATAEDATQEAFVRALERWDRLRDQPWAAGWVTTTAVNLARRMLRRRRWMFRVGSSAIDPAADGALDLWRAVKRLPRRQQQAVTLYYVLDLPVAQVATVMGCREGTVKAHLARAREELRTWLEGAPDDR